jgi:hypothetical protein
MGSGKPKPGRGGSCRTSQKQQLVIKKKKKGKGGRGKTENLGSRQKERMVFKMEVWKSTLLAEIYKEQKQL